MVASAGPRPVLDGGAIHTAVCHFSTGDFIELLTEAFIDRFHDLLDMCDVRVTVDKACQCLVAFQESAESVGVLAVAPQRV